MSAEYLLDECGNYTYYVKGWLTVVVSCVIEHITRCYNRWPDIKLQYTSISMKMIN